LKERVVESSVVKGLFVRSTLGAASLIALTLLIFSARGDTPPASASKQVIVIGIDGATWEIIDALRSQGKLPTFDRLIRAGSRGELTVPLPSISPSLWTTIATGVPASVHGIEDFWSSSSGVATKRIWEIADERGLTSGVLGYLVTWPPGQGGSIEGRLHRLSRPRFAIGR
jgi:hypothetical protein